MAMQSIVPTEGYVFVFEGRSSAKRALNAGAVSVEVRIVFMARLTELEMDPEQIRRQWQDPGMYIPEARRFIRPGPVSLAGRDPMIEKP